MTYFRTFLHTVATAAGAILAVMIISTGQADAESIYGPPIEIGVSVNGVRYQSRPDWSSKYSGGYGVMGAVRIFHGLAIQGGKSWLKGDEPYPDMVEYSPNHRLWTEDKTFHEKSWYGLRYEIPMIYIAPYIKSTLFGMDFLCLSGGMASSNIGLFSRYKFTDDEKIDLDGEQKFRMATVKGPYVGIAGRWRFQTEEGKESGSWMEAFGLETGMRYTRYSDSSLRYSVIDKPKSHFNTYEIYLLGFVKIQFLYD